MKESQLAKTVGSLFVNDDKVLPRRALTSQKPSHIRLFRVSEIIPIRSCQKFSKQICLWGLAQSIGILLIIPIVETI